MEGSGREQFQLRKRPAEVREQLAQAIYPEGQSALTEERVRELVREELAAYGKQKRNSCRFCLPPNLETK